MNIPCQACGGRLHHKDWCEIGKLEADNKRLRAAIEFAIAQFKHDEFRSVIEQGLDDALTTVEEDKGED